MNFLATAAQTSTEAGAAQAGNYSFLIIIVLMFVAIYFITIRPEKKRQRQVEDMRNNIQIGDEISTNGGILGRVVKIKDDIVTIETGADKNKLKIFKWAIRAVEVPVNAPEETIAEEEPKKVKKSRKEKKEEKEENK